MKIRIYYEDTDCGGVVYYANYLKYLERARTEFFENKGVDIKGMKSQGIQFVVTEAKLIYKAPAFYGDVLEIETKVNKISIARFELSYMVKKTDTNQVLVEASTSLACVNKDLKPIRLPEDVRNKLSSSFTN